MPPTDPVVLTNGLRIHAVPVAQWAIRRRIMEIPEPPVPVVEIEGAGRSEENPDDPDWLEAMDKVMNERMELAFRAMIVMGCRVDEYPEGFPKPDDDEWIDQMVAAGLRRPAEEDRLWEWWANVALADTRSDYPTAYGMALAATGILEPEVMRAVEWFRGRTQRGVDSDPSAEDTGSGRGDPLPGASPGDGA